MEKAKRNSPKILFGLLTHETKYPSPTLQAGGYSTLLEAVRDLHVTLSLTWEVFGLYLSVPNGISSLVRMRSSHLTAETLVSLL